MAVMKTPGVYIVEKDAFPNSIVEVATAVPVFIGHTEKAVNGNRSLRNVPWRISSMAEFITYFGAPPPAQFGLTTKQPEARDDIYAVTPVQDPADISLGGTDYWLPQTSTPYLMSAAMSLFFQNGGGPCYIVSIGGYGDDFDASKMTKPLIALEKEQEPTLVVVPEAVRLSHQDCISVQQAMLAHCGKMMNRFAVLDVWDGWRDRQDPAGDMVDAFRDKLGINFLNYGCAYYPWVNTTIYQTRDISFSQFDDDGKTALQTLLRAELGLPAASDGGNAPAGGGASAGGDTPAGGGASAGGDTPAEGETAAEGNASAGGAAAPAASSLTPAQQQLEKAIASITDDWTGKPDDKAMLEKMLQTQSLLYRELTGHIAGKLNLIPPAAAMVGIYTMVDATRGVWKAPANVSLASVVSPTVNISNAEQEDLNVTPMGKSINAIRPFIGEGVLVWGARTLDGNSLDWRYINVRRTMIMIEESVRLAAKAYVFEPNTANTWITIKAMIANFLTGIWKAGGLAGAVPEDAFSVHVGLGETMTANDILEGILRVTVLLAPTRPAEFIEITFQQQQQRS
ncbi:MAG: phage tail sheath family protein [Alphaproteobacteria bacterium]|nr:phage tail sheath family protein [Alphaproteobacteria bacterium]MCB9931160.1 phage tail sheath family protein [Alphaproteobacteria bacterium]